MTAMTAKLAAAEREARDLTPREIVVALDKHIIGQVAAKRAVAIALRNRWRSRQLSDELRAEITPKNILMVGPTGVGKTEISRRLSKLTGAPFIKVEATKFTEVGYVGRDVESIIRDLAEAAFKMLREQAMGQLRERAKGEAEDRIVTALLGGSSNAAQPDNQDRRLALLQQLRRGDLDDKEIKVNVRKGPVNIDIAMQPGMERQGVEEATQQIQNMLSNFAGKNTQEQRRMKVRDGIKLIEEEEAARMMDKDGLRQRTVELVQTQGIVFIDEIDKVTHRSGYDGGNMQVSREGVQRDLLPLIEGSTVKTSHGMIHTDHILFIASGAFHLSKPSDLIPELQGRLPIRVEMQPLGVEEFERILVEPDYSLTEQYQALLATEGLQLRFTTDGIKQLAVAASELNERIENIGARRLHTIMEKLLEDASFSAAESEGGELVVDAAYVDGQLGELTEEQELRRFIL